MSKSLSSDTLLDKPGKLVAETDYDKTITLHEAVETFLLRLLPVIEELSTRGFPIHLLDSLRQEWIILDRIHKKTGPKD